MDYKKILENLKTNWIISAVISIVLGLVLIIFPEQSVKFLCYIMGGFAIAIGVIHAVRFFRDSPVFPTIFQSELMSSLFSIGLGLFVLTNVNLVISLVPLVIGIVLIANGISAVLRGIDAKKAGYTHWGWLLALAIVELILGALLITNPFQAAISITIWVGVGLIYAGIIDILFSVLAGKTITAWKATLK